MISYRDYNFRRYNNELDILKYGDKYAVREFYNYYGVAIEVFNLPRHNPYGNDIIKHYRAFLNALGVYIKYNGKEGFLDRHFC